MIRRVKTYEKTLKNTAKLNIWWRRRRMYGRTCGADVERPGAVTWAMVRGIHVDRRRGGWTWSTSEGQIWAVDRAEINSRERWKAGPRVRRMTVRRCAGSGDDNRWMEGRGSDGGRGFRCPAIVRTLMRGQRAVFLSYRGQVAADERNR